MGKVTLDAGTRGRDGCPLRYDKTNIDQFAKIF